MPNIRAGPGRVGPGWRFAGQVLGWTYERIIIGRPLAIRPAPARELRLQLRLPSSTEIVTVDE